MSHESKNVLLPLPVFPTLISSEGRAGTKKMSESDCQPVWQRFIEYSAVSVGHSARKATKQRDTRDRISVLGAPLDKSCASMILS